MKVRIEFLKAGKIVKTFDRIAKDKAGAAQLASQIAKDSGIDHDSERVSFERKFKALLLKDGKRVELIEAGAFDEVDAAIRARAWGAKTGKEFTDIKVQFLEA